MQDPAYGPTMDAAGSYPDFKKCKVHAIDFLEHFRVSDTTQVFKYVDMLQEIADRERKVLPIELDDVAKFCADRSNERESLMPFLHDIERNTLYFIKLFAEAADDRMPEPSNAAYVNAQKDVYDVLIEQRQRATAVNEEGAQGDGMELPMQAKPPAELQRRFEVVIHPRTTALPRKMRDIDARCLGSLVTLRGIVTQVTDIKPLITVACYLDDSGVEWYQEVKGRTFNPLLEAPPLPPPYPRNKKIQLHMQVRGCKFAKFQEVKLQELPDEVPTGETPRSLVLHLLGELTRTTKPGEVVTISGIFLPEPYTGYRAMRAGLLTSTYLRVQRVVQDKTSYADLQASCVLDDEVEAVRQGADVYNRLASSIAPEIYGHEDVKKALLLLLVDGVSRQLPDGMKLRGNIHMCLMGDPGVAKSQLLRFITHVSPRSVFTTGKGSSGVGLTAAVMKDPNTGEMVLEGGALVMADKGICCIDEFDKMDETDRTAIHEVMEQQTVSIAKAGITTTLNTRCSILAAANPAWGRYDTRRSPAENIALPPALLSRFDILWLILDKQDEETDRALAEHVLYVHTKGGPPQPEQAPLSPALLRGFVARAKSFEPHVPEALADYIAAVYAELRAEEAASDMPHSYTTARTLLSILRLSQALARLRFDNEVVQTDVDEALRLMKMSKFSLFSNEETRGVREDPISRCYARIREDLLRRQEARVTYTWADLRRLLPAGGGGFSDDVVRETVAEYAANGIWQMEGSSSNPTLVYQRSDAVGSV